MSPSDATRCTINRFGVGWRQVLCWVVAAAVGWWTLYAWGYTIWGLTR